MSRFLRGVFLCLAAAAMPALPAAAGPLGTHGAWYLKGLAGATWVEDTELVDFCCDADVSFKTGVMVGAAIGYEVTPHLALEIEAATRRADVDAFRYNSEFSGGGEARSDTLMLNAVWSFDLAARPAVHPYLGVGLGAAKLHIDGDFGDRYPFRREGVLAWQGFAGVAWDLTPRWRVFGEIRGFDTEDGHYSGPWGPATADWRAVDALVGASWRF